MKKIIIALCLFALPAAAQTTYFGIVGSAGTPTIGTCGSGASVTANSLDHSGTVNVGTGLITSCSLNFSATLVGTSRCVFGAYGLLTSPILSTATVTSSGFTLTFVATIAGAKIDYHCFIN